MANIILGLVGVLITVLSGTYFATWRLRKERAFEQRLSWCKQTLEAVNQAGFAITAAKSVEPDDPSHAQLWAAAEVEYSELLKTCGMKEVFAPEEAVTAINEFTSAYRRLLTTPRDERNSGACESCMTELRGAAKELIVAGRSHLAMKPLPENLVHNEVRYQGYYLPSRGLDPLYRSGR